MRRLFKCTLFLIGILFLLASGVSAATTFTIDTIDTQPFNPVTTPVLTWTVGTTNMLTMTGAATPSADITAKLDGGTLGISEKKGFGFPTSRWSISFENLKTGTYNVTLTSESTNITFKINVTNTHYTGGNTTTPVPTGTLTPPVSGSTEWTIILSAIGVLFLFSPLVLSKVSH